MKIDMGDQDFIAVSALRYAIGRRTYIVQETCQWMKAHWRELDTRAQDVMVCDLDEALAGDAPVGMECDHKEWVALRAFIQSCDDENDRAYMEAKYGA